MIFLSSEYAFLIVHIAYFVQCIFRTQRLVGSIIRDIHGNFGFGDRSPVSSRGTFLLLAFSLQTPLFRIRST